MFILYMLVFCLHACLRITCVPGDYGRQGVKCQMPYNWSYKQL